MMPVPTMDPPDAKDAAEFLLFRGRPRSVQDLRATPGSLETVLFWNAPQDMSGVDGWRIFQDNETNLIQQIDDRNVRQVTIKMAGNSKAMFYVCPVSKFGREGPKIPVLASSDTNQIVSAGTTGATSGSAATPDPDWQSQGSGGHYRGRNSA